MATRCVLGVGMGLVFPIMPSLAPDYFEGEEMRGFFGYTAAAMCTAASFTISRAGCSSGSAGSIIS
jgi:MFS family permease